MAKDFFGNEVKVGDTVAFAQVHYRNLMIGRVVKITPKMFQLSHGKTLYGEKSRQFHEQVILCPPEMQNNAEENNE